MSRDIRYRDGLPSVGPRQVIGPVTEATGDPVPRGWLQEPILMVCRPEEGGGRHLELGS